MDIVKWSLDLKDPSELKVLVRELEQHSDLSPDEKARLLEELKTIAAIKR
ncbi:hypothetical protein O9H85_07535 [Paenibacillus filicis]|uniref:Uncharacterized protein n=1 Tax=Paenibacillus gyeongsangnamensis TaxID=3388067 RepID=A0ABT4Q619_9BACL|nr:hypothetical protein [Paenibacillus filicis]MCZ8512281.1 hypothetical protein [Paenibacillus filicis]